MGAPGSFFSLHACSDVALCPKIQFRHIVWRSVKFKVKTLPNRILMIDVHVNAASWKHFFLSTRSNNFMADYNGGKSRIADRSVTVCLKQHTYYSLFHFFIYILWSISSKNSCPPFAFVLTKRSVVFVRTYYSYVVYTRLLQLLPLLFSDVTCVSLSNQVASKQYAQKANQPTEQASKSFLGSLSPCSNNKIHMYMHTQQLVDVC